MSAENLARCRPGAESGECRAIFRGGQACGGKLGCGGFADLWVCVVVEFSLGIGYVEGAGRVTGGIQYEA